MRKEKTFPLTDEQITQLRALDRQTVDTDDIPEAPAGNWPLAERGRFFRPIKQAINIRLDADILDWFKRHAPGGRYQTEINRVLRQYVAASDRTPRRMSPKAKVKA